MKKKIEDMFLNALGSNQRLKYYLENNINVFQNLQQLDPGFMAMLEITFAFVPKYKKREIASDFNLQRILYLLKKNRPKLYSTLINCSWGTRWLENQIENFKRKFL